MIMGFEGLFLKLYILQRYSGNDLLGVTARVIDMPHQCMRHHSSYTYPLHKL